MNKDTSSKNNSDSHDSNGEKRKLQRDEYGSYYNEGGRKIRVSKLSMRPQTHKKETETESWYESDEWDEYEFYTPSLTNRQSTSDREQERRVHKPQDSEF